MTSDRRLLRWGALALLVTLMSGCCIAPWGGRYYGYGYGDGGERHEHEHGGYGAGGPPPGDRGGWRH